MKTPEGRLKDMIKAWLKQAGAYFFMPVQTGYGMTTLDILCCLEGRFVAIETKAPGKKPTPRQLATIRDIVAAGGIAFWCDSYEGFLDHRLDALRRITNDVVGRCVPAVIVRR